MSTLCVLLCLPLTKHFWENTEPMAQMSDHIKKINDRKDSRNNENNTYN